MTTERLNGLALLHIYPDRLAKITDESILKSFVEAEPRQMEFGGIKNHFIGNFVLIFQFYSFTTVTVEHIYLSENYLICSFFF